MVRELISDCHNRWAGDPAFVIATGSSLRQADVDQVRGHGRVIVVNKAFRFAPWADVLFSIDRQFWQADDIWAEIQDVWQGGELWTVDQCSAINQRGLRWLESDKRTGFPVEKKGLGTRRLHWLAGSGGTALNLAFLFGCNPIVLLGFDMQADTRTGRIHFHEDYARGNPDEGRFRRWIPEIASMVPGFQRAGVQVINCTRSTALECFERRPLKDVLEIAA